MIDFVLCGRLSTEMSMSPSPYLREAKEWGETMRYARKLSSVRCAPFFQTEPIPAERLKWISNHKKDTRHSKHSSEII